MKLIRHEDNPATGAGPANPFEALAGEAAELDQADGGEGSGDQGGPGATPEPSNAEIITVGLELVRDTLCAFAKVSSPKRTLDKATIETLAGVWAPVCDKHGWRLSSMAGDYLPELRAGMVTAGVVVAAWGELREEMRAMKAKPVEAESAPAAAPVDA